ncbi:hypothetical protein KM043_013020 [Ampulex compressa]|nr:hypothetical protein KM043_013020 [Ampulex compressa]
MAATRAPAAGKINDPITAINQSSQKEPKLLRCRDDTRSGTKGFTSSDMHRWKTKTKSAGFRSCRYTRCRRDKSQKFVRGKKRGAGVMPHKKATSALLSPPPPRGTPPKENYILANVTKTTPWNARNAYGNSSRSYSSFESRLKLASIFKFHRAPFEKLCTNRNHLRYGFATNPDLSYCAPDVSSYIPQSIVLVHFPGIPPSTQTTWIRKIQESRTRVAGEPFGKKRRSFVLTYALALLRAACLGVVGTRTPGSLSGVEKVYRAICEEAEVPPGRHKLGTGVYVRLHKPRTSLYVWRYTAAAFGSAKKRIPGIVRIASITRNA